ncbi:hypothetical protein RSAG8_13419, partial [Rhizoctonia solani AG-8 WAC10335]
MAGEQIDMLMVDRIISFYWTNRWLLEHMESTELDVHAAAPRPPPPPSLRSDANPLHHVLTVILNLHRSLEDISLDDAIGNTRHEGHVKNMRLRGVFRTIGKRPGEVWTVVGSESEFAISENGVLVS